VTGEDGAEVALAAEAVGLELLEPGPSQARQEQRKVLDGKVVIRPPCPHGEAIVL
jgi:hypothetical protein